jgi:hypothetical protein
MSDYTGGEDPYTPLLGASSTPYDVSNTPRHEVLNYEGTPTQFSDDTGLRALLTRQGIMDVSSFNPIAKEGEKITANTARQATNDEGQLLFLDADGNQTTRPTGVPMVGGTIGDAAYMKAPRSGGGVFGPIVSDFKDMVKDPMFHKFLLTAAAIGTGGLAANAALGAGGLGALGGAAPVATAYPVSSGALLAGSELGAAGIGAGGAGSLTAGITPASVSAFEAALPATMGEIGGLSGSASGLAGVGGGLTDAQATALMQNNLLPAGMQVPASSGLTATEAMRYANLAKSGISALTKATSSPGAGLTGAALAAALAALAAKSGGSGSAPSDTPPVNPLTFNWGYQTPVQTDKYIARGQQILAPQYTTVPMAQGGVPMLNHNQRFASGGGISDLGGYSDGGRMLKGPGDGMSDSIPATIENKRPARLATDEFVVPADVVSHLGNGSSEAGAKVLYAMMEKVRKARTGNTKQGKQINPSKFMPG